MRIVQGQTLLFANLDPVGGPHTVTSVQTDAWGRPRFGSTERTDPLTGRLVGGVEVLPAGTYEFFCGVHVQMRGVLEVTGTRGTGSS